MGGGFLNFNKNDSNDAEIAPIKNELKKQSYWINQLHSYSKDLHNYATDIKHSNTKHKKEILEHIQNLNGWITYLNDSHNTIKKDISSLKSEIRKELQNDFQHYHKTMLEYVSLKLREEAMNKQDIKEQIGKELKKDMFSLLENYKPRIIRQEPQVPQNKPTEQLQTEVPKQVQQPQVQMQSVELTNPEKELLSLLFNAGKPLTYEDMANTIGKSVNSVRVYMNSLKTKRDIIDEFTTPQGKKIYSIKNSTVVKTLFNIN